MAESEEELKIFLMKVKEESEKAGLKLSTHTKKIMTSNPIISWHGWGNSGNSGRFYFLGLQNQSWLLIVTEAMKSKDTCPLEEKV